MRFRFGQVLTRTEATLSGFRLVRNLSEPHAQPVEHRRAKLEYCRLLKTVVLSFKVGNAGVPGVRFR